MAMIVTILVRAGLVLATSTILQPILTAVAHAQSNNQTTPRVMLQGQSEQSTGSVFRDALNRPCLDVRAISRAHVANPAVVDHVVSVKNNCPRLIKVKVCYFNSDKCNELLVTGYGREDTILGSMSGVKYFRYSITQR